MGKEKTPAKTAKKDADGNLVLEEWETEEATYKKVKYGVIRIMGDPNEHRISYETLKAIADKPPLFNGDVIIPEMHVKVPLNRIVFQQFRDEEQKRLKNFAKLPTSAVLLDLNEDKMIAREDLKGREAWREATAHYQEGTDGREYYLNRNQLKRCLWLHREKGESEFYPPSIYRIEKYGIDQEF